ncbi:MFS transporter [Marmoricola endophyticus]|uniref:MFS transporter n=1 Tax=Marmoricola endophyticus TaxID=2040280 RepID=A0A917BEH6_9ACTN|nr:MFS transporter [Marmoricola endophyticus]GGF36763.1 MFS transporter [Marmoricola endophyticus]
MSGWIDARRAGIAIALVLSAQLMLVLDTTVVNVALPRIATDLGFGPASLSWVLNAYALAFGGLLVLGGRIGDAIGRRRAFTVGLWIFVAASALAAIAQTPADLITFRALQGVGAALAAPSTLALLTTSARDESGRLRALALFGAVSSGGLSLGLILGGALTDLGSWRWTMVINVPIGLAVLALVRRFVTETEPQRGRFDVVGAITATGGAIAVVWSLIGAPEHGWTSARTIGGLVVGALLLAGLVLTERRVAHPLVEPTLLRDRNRVGALVAMALVVGGQLSMFYLVVQLVQGSLGFGPMASGLAFLPLSLTVLVMSRFSPRVVARFGAARPLMVGAAGLVTSYLWLAEVGTTSSYAVGIFGPMLLIGLSMSLCFMPITSLVLGGVAPEHAGSASGLLQTTQQLGSAVGIAVIASVYAAGAVPGQVVPGMRGGFTAAAVFAALTLLTATALHVRAVRSARTVEAPDAPAEVLEAA